LQEGGAIMTNEVWERVVEFLADLRCSDMQRESLVHLDSCNIEKEKLNALKGKYAKTCDSIDIEYQKIIEEYVTQLQKVSFEEQHEAYCQGIVDTLQILSGLKLLPMNEKVQKLIEILR
jgi:hypothetical protein